ncbi:TPA: hypothetical protein ICA47_004391 [Escherichia coli]|nr:hypothetical protein [Escherichia coli]
MKTGMVMCLRTGMAVAVLSYSAVFLGIEGYSTDGLGCDITLGQDMAYDLQYWHNGMLVKPGKYTMIMLAGYSAK